MSDTAIVWTAQENDVIGGWCVTNYPHPLSEHDLRPNGNPARWGYVIADMMRHDDAQEVARLLNEAEVERLHPAEYGREGER